MKENIAIFKRLLKALYPFRKRILFIIFIMLLSSGISFVRPLLNKYLIDEGLIKNNFHNVLRYSIVSLLLVIADQLLSLAQSKKLTYINNLYTYKWTSLSMRKLMKLKLSYLNENNFTEIINNAKMDIASISQITDESFAHRLLSLLKIMGGLIGLTIISYKLSVMIIMIIPVKYLLTAYFTRLRKKLHKRYMEYARDYSKWYGDKMSGIKEIKLSGIENIIMRQFAILQRSIIKTSVRSQIIDGTKVACDLILLQLMASMIYIIGSKMIVKDAFTIGGLFAFATYSTNVIMPISSLINIRYDMAKILLSAKRLFDFLDMECEDARKDSIRIKKDEIKGKIVFKNVSHSYRKDNEVLKNVSFEINPGEKVGIVGLNGSGKTSVFNILLRLYDFQNGNVYIDDMDIRRININDLRKTISVVNQDLYIFNATIEENISMFNNHSEDRIKKAMDLSFANELIDNLPEGSNTRLGDKGSKLSGGERQRIALARAFAKECKIILLDEATSSFDLKHEERLIENLLSNFSNHTILFITHRPYVLHKLDKIIVMDKGKVVDVGKHDELIRGCSLYADILREVEYK
ncbi:ABC transporter ATP-binding protein [Lutispora saccharofermentans]|uniref:ABC transporter ATP-binding protein/permease n=1 Tax=Lutispora saccharofermentans TaxID=3024236 RepID=A0ABT1NJJ7_9FIRM|nr:ABC transporter ATP-binding protein/permease [Lutispora saccharofermentans]